MDPVIRGLGEIKALQSTGWEIHNSDGSST